MSVRLTLLRLVGLLRLTRVSTAFAAVANVWFVILWTRAEELAQAPAAYREHDLWLLLLSGAVLGASFYAFAACLNDVVDASRDRAMRRDRPITTGQVAPEAAVMVVAVTLALSMLAASVFGSGAVSMTAAAAMVTVVFNLVGTRVPAIGILTLALIYVLQMMAPNISLRFLWPVWLVVTHALAVNVTAHAVGRKRPPLSPRAIAFGGFSWLAMSAGLTMATRHRTDEVGAVFDGLWPGFLPIAAVGVQIIVAGAFAIVAYRRIRSVGPGQRAADKVFRYGALWLCLYGCVWLLAAGAIQEALVMSGLAAFGFIGMAVLREAYSALEHSTGFRR